MAEKVYSVEFTEKELLNLKEFFRVFCLSFKKKHLLFNPTVQTALIFAFSMVDKIDLAFGKNKDDEI